MTDKVLYTLVIPKNAESGKSVSTRRRVSKQGVITGGSASTENVATEPDERTIFATLRGRDVGEVAREFEELFAAPGVEEVPFYGRNGSVSKPGYYVLEDVTREPGDPRTDPYHTIDAKIVRKGTRASSYRSVNVQVTSGTNDFGNSNEMRVAVPAAATKVRWFVSESKTRDNATAVDTRTGQHGDIDIYEVTNSTLYDGANNVYPDLIYDLDYSEEGKVDMALWDDMGHTDKVTTVTRNGVNADVRQWRKVFESQHEFTGKAVLESRRLRLTFDEGTNSLTAARWDDANSKWASVSLGASDWELLDFDATSIGLAEVRAQVEFRDTTQSPTAYYTLNMILQRGFNDAQWFRPKNENSPTPSGLVTLLDPVAATSTMDPQVNKTIKSRSEVRK